MESLGEKIRQIRKSKGISQMTVADTCNIKQSSYANIESGKTQNITIEIGKGIAKALGVPFNELFEIENIIIPKDKDFQILILSNYVLSVLSHYSLLLELSAHEELSEFERTSFYKRRANIQNGLYLTLKRYKEQNKIDNETLRRLIEMYPSLDLWQRLLEPVKELIE